MPGCCSAVCAATDWSATRCAGAVVHLQPDLNRRCGQVRIQADYVERYLLEQIQQRDQAALESPAQAPVLTALRQLQDDHYDGLVDRCDYLRQSDRLRSALRVSPPGTSSPPPLPPTVTREPCSRGPWSE